MNRVHPALTVEHEALRETMRRFVAREIAPHAAACREVVDIRRAERVSQHVRDPFERHTERVGLCPIDVDRHTRRIGQILEVPRVGNAGAGQ